MLYLKPVSKIRLYVNIVDGEFKGMTETVVDGGESIEVSTMTGLQAARATEIYRGGKFDYPTIYALLHELTGADQTQLDPSFAIAILAEIGERSRPSESDLEK